MRRVVTGVNPDGKSYVQSDEEIKDSGFFWTSDPEATRDWIRAIDPAAVLKRATPPKGGAKCALVELLPQAGIQKVERPGQGMDARGFHVTPTVDYIYVIIGQIVLDLDEGSVLLNPGDVVVQQATRHAWRNATDKTAKFMVVLVSAEC